MTAIANLADAAAQRSCQSAGPARAAGPDVQTAGRLAAQCVKASYTRHGHERVLGRLSLSPTEVADMLDWDLAVNIGSDEGKAHRLFYSVPDRKCFVAIQDPVDGAIITVLPLDFYENLAGPVTRDAQDKARWLVSPRAARNALKRKQPSARRTIR